MSARVSARFQNKPKVDYGVGLTGDGPSDEDIDEVIEKVAKKGRGKKKGNKISGEKYAYAKTKYPVKRENSGRIRKAVSYKDVDDSMSEDGESTSSSESESGDENDTNISNPPVSIQKTGKGRGRPKKAVSKDDSGSGDENGAGEKKGRGRPKKAVSSGDENAAGEPPAKISKRGRGRPKKSENEDQVMSDHEEDADNDKVTESSSPVKTPGRRGRPKKVTKEAVENDNDNDSFKSANDETSSKSEDEVMPDSEMDSSKADNGNETKDATDPSECVDDDKDNGTESSPAKNKKAGKAPGRPAKKTGRGRHLKKVTENVVEPDNASKSVEGKDSTVSDDEKAIVSPAVTVEVL